MEHLDVDAVELDAFALADDLAPFDGDRHAHRFHQLLYSAAGALHLEVETGQWLLPPQRAAWVSSGALHRVSARHPVLLRTIYLAPELAPPTQFEARVFSVSALAREMILHAMRWGHERDGEDPLARDYFRTLAGLSAEWITASRPFHLPTARSDELRRATRFILAHLERELSIEEVARVARLSVRTLTRRFAAETNTTFRAFLHAARMLHAMDLLAAGSASVTEVALAVGFTSTSAFSTAFGEFVGEPPSGYRARAR